MLAQQVSDGSYYADCRGLYREPELEIAVDIVKDNGTKYQVFARGKHRGQMILQKNIKYSSYHLHQ